MGGQQTESSAASEHVGPSRARVLLRRSTWGQAEREFYCAGARGAQQNETSAAPKHVGPSRTHLSMWGPAERDFCCAGPSGAQHNETSAASKHVGPSSTRVLLCLSKLGLVEREFCCDSARKAQQNESPAAQEHVRPSRTRLLLRRSTLGPAEREFCCACMLLHACSGGRGGIDRPCGSKVVLIITAEYTPSFVWQRGGTKDVCYVRALRAYYLRRGRLSFEQG